jgi:hypothetical protein
MPRIEPIDAARRAGEPGPMVLAMANAPAECHVSMSYLAWAAAVGAGGCGRCVNAV